MPYRTHVVSSGFSGRLRIREEIEEPVDPIARLRALGITVENAFCPTGPGGGIDPTCSPGGGGASGLPKDRKRLTIQKAEIALLERGVSMKVLPYDLKKKTARYKLTDSDGKTTEATAKQVADFLYDNTPIHNIFCPTGKGGGIDPTCSPGGAKGSVPSKGGEGLGFTMKPVNPDADDTQTAYKDATGHYTKERQALHNRISGEYFKGKTPVKEGQPIAYVMGGGTASGKSTVIRTGALKVDPNTVVIDPDNIKGKLPEYKNGVAKKNTKTSAFCHEESSELSKEILAKGSKGGYNTMLDGTGDSNYKKLSGKVEKMKAAGQKVVATYVTVDTDVAVQRAYERGKKRGRFVPESVIRGTHKSVSQVVPEALKNGLFDQFDLWDTNGSEPVHVATAQGKKVTILNQERWSAFLAKGKD